MALPVGTDAQSGDALLTLCQKSEIGSLAVSADANWLAIGLVHRDGAYVWDLKTRQEVAHLAAGEAKVRLAFSPSEALLAFTSDRMPESGEEENTLRLWDGNARQTVARFPLRGLCLGLSFSSDGRVLATSTSQEITLWHVPDGTKIATYAFQRRAVDSGASFATTADMSLAAFEGGAGLLRVISLHDGKEVWSAAASKDYLPSLSFSPDGKTLATGGGLSESDIRLWETASGKELGRLEGHKSWVSSLVFCRTASGWRSSGADQTIRIWDVEDRKCLDVLRGHVLEVWRLALAPDQKTPCQRVQRRDGLPLGYLGTAPVSWADHTPGGDKQLVLFSGQSVDRNGGSAGPREAMEWSGFPTERIVDRARATSL